MPELTRRQLLLGGSAIGAVAATSGFAMSGVVSPGQMRGWMASDEQPGAASAHRFVSRPDLRPPVVTVTSPARGTDPGHLFLTVSPGYNEPPPSGAQAGPLIIDDAGQPIWFAPTRDIRPNDFADVTADLEVQTFGGLPVLTWWRGDLQVPPGVGNGEFVIADSSYREIATVRAGSGMQGDLHEFLITAQDTALVIAYQAVQHQGRSVLECVVQELEIGTGRVLFEWRSLAHVPLDESLEPPPGDPAQPYDYIHLNSVAEDSGDTLLVSARNTQAVYRISRDTGGVVWRLGGSNSDFTLGPGAQFVMQHDARRLPDGTVSIFDNGVPQPTGENSRAIVLRVDEATRRAELVREHVSPDALLAANQGNAQFLPSGNAFVGWGNREYFTEFSRAGAVLFDATYGPGLDSYRVFRFEWDATPVEPPVAAARNEGQGMTVYASWNGATRVARWRVLTGPSPDRLDVVREADRTGFETAVTGLGRQPFATVAALDRSGVVLGGSAVARARG